MQIIQVRPGADRAALSEMADQCGMRVGIQGGMQVLIADSPRRDVDKAASTESNKED